MAEKSMLWTTGSTGDGLSPYSQTEWIKLFRRLFVNDQRASQGVLVGFNNALAVSSGAVDQVTVATGGAIVDGFPYENDASLNLAITRPAVGTTGGRVSLRANYAAQTVRATVTRNTDGVAGIPALTQSDGVTWDIPLATFTITTGGVVTVTDARSYAHFASRVALENLDTDVVDDTIVGNRVPALTRRQGGDATNWSTSGGTTYTPTNVRMQVGNKNVTVAIGDIGASATISFPVAFSAAPVVIAVIQYNFGGVNETRGTVTVFDTSASQANINVSRHKPTDTTASQNVNVMWIAIGAE